MSRVIGCVCATAVLMLASLGAHADEVMVQFPTAKTRQVAIGKGTFRLIAPGFSSTTLPGDPALPYREISVLLPSSADVKTLELKLTDQVEEELPGSYDIAPTPPKTPAGHANRNPLTYGTRTNYPSAHAALGRDSYLGPYLLVKVRCWPYMYNPVTMKLRRLTSAKLVISFSNTESNPKPKGADIARYLDRLQKTAENWQQSLWWYGLALGGRKMAVAGPPNAILILTTSDIQKASTKLTEFITHKRKMGFTVNMINETAWGGGTDAVASERIRNYLKKVYKNYHYLLIIGDPRYTSQVPMKKTYSYWFDFNHESDINTDCYYADLTGNWDLNGNGYYGEWLRDGGLSDFGPGGVDLIPELVVGRIPYYGVPADLDKILTKTIRYETMPEVGDWVQRVLIPMEPFSKGEPSWMYGEPVKNDVVLPARYGYSRVYEDTYDLVPAPEAHPCNEDAVLAEWKKGYGLVFWATHGGPQGAGDVFSTPKCASLDDSRPSFTFQGSCFTAHPETTDNLAYALLVKGAVVTVASTRMSGGAMDDGNIGIGIGYARNLLQSRQRCGDALWNALINVTLGQAVWNNHCSYVLYGDPTLTIRWPTSFSVSSPPGLLQGEVNKSYGQDLFAAGSKTPYVWTLASGSLPPGLKLSRVGSLSGTPTTAGDYRFTLQVRSSSKPQEMLAREFTLRVAEAAAPAPESGETPK